MVNDHYTESLRMGRQFLSWAILIECLSLVELLPITASKELNIFLTIVYTVELGLIAYGIYKVGQYYQFSLAKKLLYTAISATPFIGILIVMLMEKKSSKSLRQEGYQVNFFGASRLTVS